MVKIFDTSEISPEEIAAFFQNVNEEAAEQVTKTVREIIKDVDFERDKALIKYTNKFDRANISDADELLVSSEEIDEACKNCDPELLSALELAAERIALYHEKQMPRDFSYKDKQGVTLGNVWKPLWSVGVYVPGGLASYPSSVLMNAVPARVAGVKEIIMVVPAPEGNLNPAVLAAARIAGVDQIFKVGGAQAVAALAFGTETVPNVDKIVGPGNAYVAAAKRELFGTVGIDMIAGPSEILVVADKKTDPEWIAADLLSQAEHDENARSILVTDKHDYADKVVEAIEWHLSTLERADIARKSWENNGAIIVDHKFKNVVDLVDYIAPEHLELAIDKPEKLAKQISNAGAIFLGRYTPEAIGDYTAGPSHVLPTSGTAWFSSGLSVYDFLKRMSVIGCTEKSFEALADATQLLAESEGLGAHALSISLRRK